jgi:hypothetical protein
MYHRITTIVIAGLLGLGTATTAGASHHHASRPTSYVHYASLEPSPDGRVCLDSSCETSPVPREMSHAAHRFHFGSMHRSGHGPAVSDLTSALASKVSEIISACGARLTSGYRPGARVAGSGHPSLHSVYPARAADVAGNPSCIYSHLQGWQGGYSTDYGRVRHIHISFSPPGAGYLAGREWHARFGHYEGGGYRSHHRDYAMR